MGTENISICSGYDPLCVKQAINTLSRYKTFIHAFLTKYKTDVPDNNREMLDEIVKTIRRDKGKLRCKELLEYTDQLKMWGKQHIILFSLKENNKEYLNKLSDRDFIKSSLSRNELIDRYNSNICILNTVYPILSEVKHIYDKEGNPEKLFFKWIETRSYQKLLNNQLKNFEERSANFFIINLKDGTAELRLQSLQNRAAKKLQAEIDIYMKEIMKFIDLNLFEIITLEPVMKRFLLESILPVSHWRIKSKNGNLEGSKIARSIIARLKLPFQNFFSHEISVYWQCKQDVNQRDCLYFTLNGYNNTITFNSITDNTKVDYLLDILRKNKKEHPKYGRIQMKELRELAKEETNDRALIYVTDYYFKKMRKREIHSGEFALETGFDEYVVKNIFTKAAKKFPNRFSIKTDGEHIIFSIEILFITYGWFDKLTRRIGDANKTIGTKLAAHAALLPPLALIRLAFQSVISWYIQDFWENFSGIPLYVFEVATYVLVIFMFYGGKRIKTLMSKIPTWLFTKFLEFNLGKTADLIINSKEYEKWLKKV